MPESKDECPKDPEDRDGFEDDDGCPDKDNDKDGILDADDKCPNEPETYNGLTDEDGCPDRGGVIILDAPVTILDIQISRRRRSRDDRKAAPVEPRA